MSDALDWFFYGSLLWPTLSPAELLWTSIALGGFLLNLFALYEAQADLYFLRLRGINGARVVVARGHRRASIARSYVKFLLLLLGFTAAQAPPSPFHSAASKLVSLFAISIVVVLTWVDYSDRADREKITRIMAHRRTVIDPLIDGVLTIDASSTILRASLGIAAVLGYLPHELVGSSLAKLLSVEEYSTHLAHLDHYLATGEGPTLGRPHAVFAARKDGGVVPLEMTIFEVGFGAERRWNCILRIPGAIEREE